MRLVGGSPCLVLLRHRHRPGPGHDRPRGGGVHCCHPHHSRAAAAEAAMAPLTDAPADIDGYLARANAAMRGTRGAAVGVCRLQPDRGELRYLSVGNVSGGILGRGGQCTLIAYRGTVGTHAAPPPAKILSYPWPPGATLVLWTDGLAGHIDLAAYTGLFGRDPAIAAAALHRDHSTDRDDSTVVVVRNHTQP